MLHRPPVQISSVHPLEGHEGTIVTLKGSGFAPHIRNSCVVLAGMGACARAEPGATATQLQVRIGPVARETQGDLLMWPGIGLDLHTEVVEVHNTNLRFSETAIFRNAAPVAAAGINFKLTRVSPNTYSGQFLQSAPIRVELGGYESGAVMQLRIPTSANIHTKRKVDICLVLKEPTLAIDFTADIAKASDDEYVLHAIAKGITANASMIGEGVYASVVKNPGSGETDLYVTKPYLTNGMLNVKFT